MTKEVCIDSKKAKIISNNWGNCIYSFLQSPMEFMSKRTRSLIRAACGARGSSCPIKLVDGNQPPQRSGESFYYRTRGGVRIRHPNAYAKIGRSNMVYVNSSKVIEVSKLWLEETLNAKLCK